MFKIIKNLVEHKYFQGLIIGLIIINGITMGLSTSKEIMNMFGNFIFLFDTVVIIVFTIEIILRIYVYKKDFFKDPWSIFDFAIVSISLVPSSAGFEILRILRVLRLLRLITVVPQMRKIVMALLSTIPGMASIAGLMALFFYIFAIMSVELFGTTFPQWFGSLGESFYTLFQIMTLESWSMGIVRPIMEVHPYAWTFFIPFIFLATFIMINLIIAVVVDAMGEITKEDKETFHETSDEVKELHKEIVELKALVIELKDQKRE